MHAKDRLGRYGEDLAAEHLDQVGAVLLERNWRCEHGELDIIAAEDEDLVVCEVKTRSSTAFGTPLEAVDTAKLHRMQKAAHAWCRAQRLHPPRIRYDVIEVLVPPHEEPTLTHHRGVC